MPFSSVKRLVQKTNSKIVMLVITGLGATVNPLYQRTGPESARVPYLDRITQHNSAGLSIPVAWGIASGSGPGQVALLAYDP
jgi:2,3-bisphosphoglycerate-independent phosphoglycerate mutase